MCVYIYTYMCYPGAFDVVEKSKNKLLTERLIATINHSYHVPQNGGVNPGGNRLVVWSLQPSVEDWHNWGVRFQPWQLGADLMGSTLPQCTSG